MKRLTMKYLEWEGIVRTYSSGTKQHKKYENDHWRHLQFNNSSLAALVKGAGCNFEKTIVLTNWITNYSISECHRRTNIFKKKWVGECKSDFNSWSKQLKNLIIISKILISMKVFQLNKCFHIYSGWITFIEFSSSKWLKHRKRGMIKRWKMQ